MSDYPYKAQDIAKIDSHIVPAFSETKDPNTGKIYGYISKAEAMDYALSLKAAATMLGEGAEGRLKTVTYENITLSPESIKKGITKNDALLDYIERAVVNGDPIKKAVYNDVFFNKDFAKSMFGALSLMEVEMVKYADLNGKVIQLPAGVVVGMNGITQPTTQPEAGALPKKVPFFLARDEQQVANGPK